MKHLQQLFILFMVLAGNIIANVKAQETEKEWFPIKIDRLGLQASFYQAPVASTTSEDGATRYCFENKVEENEHPSKLYRITVWESNNPSDNTYTDRKEEELINQKLHGSHLQLISKSSISRGIPLSSYILKNEAEEYICFSIGSSKGRIYVIEIECRKDGEYLLCFLQFIQSFLIDNSSKDLQSISIDSLDYTADFPHIPEVIKINHPEDGIEYYTVARALPPTKETEVTFWDGEKEDKVIMQKSDSPIESYKISGIHYSEKYASTEISAKKEDIFQQDIIHSIVNDANGKLLKKEKVQNGNLQGMALFVKDEGGMSKFLYRVFYVNRTMYILEVILENSADPKHPDVIRFMESFSIK